MSSTHLPTDHDLLAATAPGADGPYRFRVTYYWRLTTRTVTVDFAILNGRDRHLFAREYADRMIGANAKIYCVERIGQEPADDAPDQED